MMRDERHFLFYVKHRQAVRLSSLPSSGSLTEYRNGGNKQAESVTALI